MERPYGLSAIKKINPHPHALALFTNKQPTTYRSCMRVGF